MPSTILNCQYYSLFQAPAGACWQQLLPLAGLIASLVCRYDDDSKYDLMRLGAASVLSLVVLAGVVAGLAAGEGMLVLIYYKWQRGALTTLTLLPAEGSCKCLAAACTLGLWSLPYWSLGSYVQTDACNTSAAPVSRPDGSPAAARSLPSAPPFLLLYQSQTLPPLIFFPSHPQHPDLGLRRPRLYGVCAGPACRRHPCADRRHDSRPLLLPRPLLILARIAWRACHSAPNVVGAD